MDQELYEVMFNLYIGVTPPQSPEENLPQILVTKSRTLLCNLPPEDGEESE